MKQQRVLERRFTPGAVEVHDSSTIEGHAAVFGKLSDNLGGFVEIIERSAFTKTVKEADVRALKNHNPDYVLGRTSSGTLDLSIDDSGLYYRIKAPDTTYARDLMVVMERGDVNQSSFAFFTVEDDWSETEQDYPLRSLIEVGLVDVSPVTFPAYQDADSGLGRNAALASLAVRSGLSVTDLSDADAIKAAVRANKFTVAQSSDCPDSKPWAVLDSEGDVVSCNVDRNAAMAAMQKAMDNAQNESNAGNAPTLAEVRAQRIRQIRQLEVAIAAENT